MPVNTVSLPSTLTVTCQIGTTPAGGPVTRKKTLSGIKADASDQDVYDVAAALFSLVQDQVIEVIRSRNSELIDE